MNRKNKKTLFWLLGTFAVMLALSFASVPLYRIFCQTTGFGGTTQVAKQAPKQIEGREVTIRFNTDVYPGLDWSFQPSVRSVTLKIGEVGRMSFHVKNNGGETVTASSSYNVTPEKAGIYFNKLQCFCFTEHTLKPGETAEYPVQFFIDPDMIKDAQASDVDTITLSYTFFPAAKKDLVSTLPQPELNHNP